MSAMSTFIALVLLSAVLGIIQLVMGAPFEIVVLAIGTVIVGLVPILFYGLSHIVGVLFLMVACYFSLDGLIVKTILTQTINSNLYTPNLSFLVVFVGVFSSAVGALAARPFVKLDRSFVKPVLDPERMRLMAIIFMFLAVPSFVLGRLGGSLTAAAVILSGFFPLAFVLETAHAIIVSQKKRTWSLLSLGIAILVLGGSAASNSKAGFLVIGFAYVLTVIFFKVRLKPIQVAALAFGAIFFMQYISPAIYMTRGGRQFRGPIEQIEQTIETSWGLIVGDPTIEARAAAGEIAYERFYDPDLYNVRYLFAEPGVLDRFIMVGFIDSVLRRIPPDGPFAGYSFVFNQLPTVLPVFLNPDKFWQYSGDVILWNLRLEAPGGYTLPTLGVFSESFYAAGFPGVIFFGLLAYFPLCLVLSWGAGRMSGNVFSVYLVATYVHFLICSINWTFASFIFRTMPTDILFFYAAFYAAELIAARRPTFGSTANVSDTSSRNPA